MREERDELKEELLTKKEWAFDDLDSLSIQIAKDAKIRKCTIGKVFTRERTKFVAEQAFAEKMKYVTIGPHFPSQQKPGIEMGLSRKDPWNLCLTVWIFMTYMGESQSFENVTPAETLPAWTEKDRVWMKWKKIVRLTEFHRQEQADGATQQLSFKIK